MAMYKHDIIRWLQTLPDDAHVGTDDGGNSLVCLEDREAYLEIGGLPEDEDDRAFSKFAQGNGEEQPHEDEE